MAKEESPSHRKHRRLGDDGERESDSKRRKHHSRSGRRRHHRHSSKHIHDEGGYDDANRRKLVDYANDDMEEGEILEDEDGGVVSFQDMVVHSDVESGEIKPEEAMEDASSLRDNLEEFHINKDKNLPAVKRLYVERDSNVEVRSMASADTSPSGAGNASEDGCIDKLDKTKRGKSQERKRLVFEPKKRFDHDDGIYINGDMHIVDKEAPSTSSSEGYNINFCSKSKEVKEGDARNKKRSLSPESSVDNYGKRVQSPSSDILVHVRDKATSPDHQVVRASATKDNMHAKNFMHVTASYDSKIKVSKGKDQARHSRTREEKNNVVDSKKSADYQKLELYERNMDMDKDKEHDPIRGSTRDRSRNSVSSRHGEGEEKTDPLERVREKHKDKERNQHSSQGRDRVRERGGDRERNRRDSCDRDRDREKNRERSRHESQDRERDKDGGKTGHDYRGRSKFEDHERDKDRENNRYITHNRDGERDLDRDRDRERERQRDKRMVKERERDGDVLSKRYRRESLEDHHGRRDKYSDSRRSKYAVEQHGRHGLKTKELTKDASGVKLDQGKEAEIRDEDEGEDFQERIALQLAEQEEEDIDRIKEESRKRRQAILEKYRQPQAQQDETSISEKDGDNLNHAGADAASILQGSSDADEGRHETTDLQVADQPFLPGKLPVQNGDSNMDGHPGDMGFGGGSPKSEKSEAMFCDDIFGESPPGIQKPSEKSEDMFCDDIFGESPASIRKPGKGDGLKLDKGGLHDNWDDSEGYYSYRIGEVLDGRYEITAGHGKGVFSTVVRAKDLKAGNGDPEEVAVKIIRSNDTMYKAGMEEVNVLNKLVGADPEDRRHCVRFILSFKYRNHLCLVFESLNMNLREVLKKFGRNIGLKLTAIRAYAKQLFIALKHLKNCGVLHCDIKPDNMLVNEAKNVLKLCDFGNAMFAGKNEITPYLVSRFYRAPEIILGLPYDHPLDIWSVGCCLYELYTGRVLFPGPSNNDMLRLHMELKGPFPKKMLRKGAFTDHHFDQDLNFHATEEDPMTKKTVKRLLVNIKMKDTSNLISSYPGEDPKMLASFKDLLDRTFVLDPEKRLTVSQALSHPFITGK